jgi:hypothetical protein
MSEFDKSYYRARGAAERELAASAANPKIAAIHLDMAARYDILAATGAAAAMCDIKLELVTA